MSGTPNPSANFVFGDGNLQSTPDLGTNAILIIGPSSGGPLLSPRRVSDQAGVTAFLHGPLVGHLSHHVGYSYPAYGMRCRASIAGTRTSTTKSAVANSTGDIALSETVVTLHAAVPGGGALNVTNGWSLPPSPLPLQITGGSGTVATNFTVTYIDQDGNRKVEVISLAAPGAVLTAGSFKQIISVTSNIDPVGTVSFTATYAGPQERYDGVLRVTRGGQISGGFLQPQLQWSADGGSSWSSSQNVPATGIVDLYAYGPGLLPQATGVRATASTSANGVDFFGSLRAPGGTVNGDVLYTAVATPAQVRQKVLGNNTPLSIDAVVAGVVVINLATDGGGVATSTGQDVVTFLMTSGTANAIAARQAIRARIVGTGLGVTIAFAQTAFTNGGLTITALQENVAVQVVESGVSTARGVVLTSGTLINGVPSKVLKITLDTDVNGIRTSTATQIKALLDGDATAAQYVSTALDGSGAGLAGDTNSAALSLPVALQTGDTWTFQTTPPTASNTDIEEALNYIYTKREDILGNVTFVALDKDGADATDFALLHAFIDQCGANKKYALRGVISGSYQGATDEQVWINQNIAAYPNRGTKVTICQGEGDTLIPAYGTQSRRNSIMVYLSRLMDCPISELPSHVECQTLRSGIQYGLPGVGAHVIPGSDPARPSLTSLWQSDDGLIQLHAQNMVTLRTVPRLAGLFVRQGLQYTIDGDDYQFITNARIADVGATIGYSTIVKWLNANLLTDPKTGQLAEIEHQRIETLIKLNVAAELINDGQRQHVSAIKPVSDRTIDFSKTHNVYVKLYIVPREPVVDITLEIDLTATLNQ